jgi:hypothetical protein
MRKKVMLLHYPLSAVEVTWNGKKHGKNGKLVGVDEHLFPVAPGTYNRLLVNGCPSHPLREHDDTQIYGLIPQFNPPKDKKDQLKLLWGNNCEAECSTCSQPIR